MRDKLKRFAKHYLYPFYLVFDWSRNEYAYRFPKRQIERMFYKRFGRAINWKEPKDLNEKIQWLKFHEDQLYWAKLADKYRVREYVKERGLSEILVPLYGVWNKTQDVLDAWDSLPDEFILKCNTGCGLILIVSKENGGKNAINKDELRKQLDKWFKVKRYNMINAELHYQYIENCVVAEMLLKDTGIKAFSRSLIDYKIWCFDGKPFGCFVAYDREIGTEHHYFDFYDLSWNEHPEYMKDKSVKHKLVKPKNFDKMIQMAAILSEGHPQVRVDFYNIDGKIFFGEMTMTSQGGFMNYFTQEALDIMGSMIDLNIDR